MLEKPYIHSIYYQLNPLYSSKKIEGTVTPSEVIDYVKFNANPDVPSSMVCFLG